MVARDIAAANSEQTVQECVSDDPFGKVHPGVRIFVSHFAPELIRVWCVNLRFGPVTIAWYLQTLPLSFETIAESVYFHHLFLPTVVKGLQPCYESLLVELQTV